jgi:hypothetical protein
MHGTGPNTLQRVFVLEASKAASQSAGGAGKATGAAGEWTKGPKLTGNQSGKYSFTSTD